MTPTATSVCCPLTPSTADRGAERVLFAADEPSALCDIVDARCA